MDPHEGDVWYVRDPYRTAEPLTMQTEGTNVTDTSDAIGYQTLASGTYNEDNSKETNV